MFLSAEELLRRWTPGEAADLFRNAQPPAARPRKPHPKTLPPEVRKQRIAKRKRRYRQQNKGKIAAYASGRKAAELRAMPVWVDRRAIERVYAEAAGVTRRTGTPHHVDHIVPLQARNVCGLHVPWNLRVIPAAENVRRPRDYRGELCF